MLSKLSLITKSVKSRKFFSRALSTSPETLADDNAALVQFQTEHLSDAINFSKKFDENFLVSEDLEWNKVRSGSYQRVRDSDMKIFFPEGISENLTKHFKNYDYAWMIRDPAKIAVQYLDHKRKFLQPTLPEISSPSAHEIPRVELARLTDRTEWKETKLKCHYYGNEIATSEIENSISNSSEVSGGNESLAEKVIQGLKGELPDKLLLTGERGTGKTFTLNQIVLHARKNGWLSLYIPNGWDQVQSGLFIEPIPDTDNLFDNFFMTKEVLRSFLKAHSQQLQQLPITEKLRIPKFEQTIKKFNETWTRIKRFHGESDGNFLKMRAIIHGDEPIEREDTLDSEFLNDFKIESFRLQTLADLALLGIAFQEFSGFVFMDLVEELKKVESFPVLIAVDEYNTWFGPAAFMIEDQRIQGFQLAVPYSLKFLSTKKAETNSWKLKNGFCIASVTLTRNEGIEHDLKNIISSVPLNIVVPAYNRWEFLAAFSFYSKYSFIGNYVKIEDLLLYRTFTGSLPWLVERECPAYFTSRFCEIYDDYLWNYSRSGKAARSEKKTRYDEDEEQLIDESSDRFEEQN